MTAIQKIDFYTESEFFTFCENCPNEKFELWHGEIVAMAGASRNHNQITQNFSRRLGNHLEYSQCAPYSSDFYVKTADETLYLPDILVDCAENARGNDRIAFTPILIIEVVSKSTRNNDFFDKLIAYQKIPTLQEYAIVEQSSTRVYLYRRQDDWQGQIYTKGQIYFQSIDYSMPIEEIYHRVIFSEQEN